METSNTQKVMKATCRRKVSFFEEDSDDRLFTNNFHPLVPMKEDFRELLENFDINFDSELWFFALQKSEVFEYFLEICCTFYVFVFTIFLFQNINFRNILKLMYKSILPLWSQKILS